MNALHEWVAGVLTATATAPVVWYSLQVLCGLAHGPRRPTSGPIHGRRMVVLIPAHGESAHIETVLGELLPLSSAQDRVLVIADNCRDDTAEIASRYAVSVLERHDPAAFGKGHALAWALGIVADDAFDVVGVIDADTSECRTAVERLKQEALRTNGPVQGCYLHSLPPDADAWSAFSCFAVVINNLIRQRGRVRLGVPCQINGNGIFMPMSVARAVDWSSDRLAEDAELGLDLSLAGHDTGFVEDAVILSPAPAGAARVLDQRSGWISGRLSLTARGVAPAMISAVRQRRPAVALAALDHAIPSASMLAAMLCAILAVVLVLRQPGAPFLIALLAWGAAAGMFAMALILAWLLHGRSLVTVGTAIRLPWMLVRQGWAVMARMLRGRATWRHYRGRGGSGERD